MYEHDNDTENAVCGESVDDTANHDTREKINALRARYGAGPTSMTDEQIAAGREVYGVGYTTIRKHMSNAGIRTKKWLDAEKWTSAEREYRHGATMRAIAKRYGVSLSAVQQHMKRRGIVPMYTEVMA